MPKRDTTLCNDFLRGMFIVVDGTIFIGHILVYDNMLLAETIECFAFIYIRQNSHKFVELFAGDGPICQSEMAYFC